MVDQWREIVAEWQGGSTFIGKNARGGSVQMGTLNERPGVSPMELILAGLAGCTGIDIVDIMEKKRQPLKALKVVVRGKRTDCYPKKYSDIEITYQIWGDDIDPRAVERAIELSEKKYCSVSAMLRSEVNISSNYQIQKTEELKV